MTYAHTVRQRWTEQSEPSVWLNKGVLKEQFEDFD